MSADLKMLESIQNTQSISREELDAILQTQDSFLIQELHKKAQKLLQDILCFFYRSFSSDSFLLFVFHGV